MIHEEIFENKPICQICLGKGYHVDIDSLGKLFTQCCPDNKDHKAEAYCNLINWEKIDPESRDDQYKIKGKNLPPLFLDILRDYIKNWPKIKKLKTHYEMVKNPENYNFVRPVKDHQFTAMHLLTRNQVFQILSKKDRAAKTKVDEFGETLDIPEVRTFLGWGGKIHFNISGPILCTYDEEVYDACIKLWHENDTKGIILETNLSEIWRTMGNTSRLNSTKIESLKRSLTRLYTVGITAKSLENKNFWGGGILDNVEYRREFNRCKDHQVIIYFNKYMIYQYLGGSYSNINHIKYRVLTPYAKKIYLFLMSHEDPNRKMSLEKWKIALGIKDTLSEKEFKRQIKDAMKELIEEKILDPQSNIDIKNNMTTFVTIESWEEKAINHKLLEKNIPF